QWLLSAGHALAQAAPPGNPLPIQPQPGAPGTSPTSPSTTTPGGIELPPILLTGIVFISLVAFFVVILLPERTDEQRGRVRSVGLFAGGLQLFLAVFFGLFIQIGLAEGGGVSTANEENRNWMSSFAFNSSYHLAADGISLVLLVLSTVLFFCVYFHSWRIRERVRLYIGLMLLLETAVNGVLCSADYVLFLIFWGMQIVPLYLLLRVWGGPARLRAANRYLAFALTSFGLFAVAAMLVIARAGQHSSDVSSDFQSLIGPVAGAGFFLTLAAFGIALGVFPVHRWLIDAQAEASPGVAAVLSGVVSKLGAYALMRIAIGQFPAAAHQYSLLITGLAVVGIAWGSLGALVQDDLRRFLGYINVAQVSLLLLAVGTQTSIALEGAVLLIVAQGFAMGMLSLMGGSLEERTRTRSIRALGGLVAQAPRLAAFWMFAVFTVIGIPLLAGFVGDFMLFVGSFPAHRVATVLALAGAVVVTGGLVWTAHRVFFGPAKDNFGRVRDIGTLELAYLVPLAVMIVLFGVRPGAVTPVITNGVIQITTRLTGGG
ncbi:MAG: NuoM family protein, partial [Candidatus Dormibacteria bacterium]